MEYFLTLNSALEELFWALRRERSFAGTHSMPASALPLSNASRTSAPPYLASQPAEFTSTKPHSGLLLFYSSLSSTLNVLRRGSTNKREPACWWIRWSIVTINVVLAAFLSFGESACGLWLCLCARMWTFVRCANETKTWGTRESTVLLPPMRYGYNS